MQYGTGEKPKLRRILTREAIALAMQGKWEEALGTNRNIIDLFPGDTDAYNRLGKAYTEFGQCPEAIETDRQALRIDSANTIARKNLERLSYLKEEQLSPKNGRRLDPQLFIAGTGKTGLGNLYHLAPPEVWARTAAGDQVQLKMNGQTLVVENMDGEYLGEVESRIGTRLVKLIEGGNRYIAAIASSGPDTGKVLIKEVFQHPSQAGRPSFPSRATEDFRPYVKDRMLKYELEGEDDEEEEGLFADAGYSIEWESSEVAPVPEDNPFSEGESTTEKPNLSEED